MLRRRRHPADAGQDISRRILNPGSEPVTLVTSVGLHHAVAAALRKAVLHGAITGGLLIRAKSPPPGSVGRMGVGGARIRERHHDTAFGIAAIV